MKIGQPFPNFELLAVTSNHATDAFITVTESSFKQRWKVYFFWPKDFTFVCPTEIKAFNNHIDDFDDRDATLLGGSIDSEYVHLAWRQQHPDLSTIQFPMLSDIHRQLANDLDILDSTGTMQRATFIVDPDNIVRFSMVTDMNVGRNPKEVLRVLDALQTDELCPCNWNKGEKTLTETMAV